ncbi:DgyrCDS14905 [Dimorphilus gyrociliatus]|uniref:DgyrCDS14905 n=1 Tax=Dimorphilus gyrociliatus TaxID=2664684 RepID=A0A7I8WFK6_9ANNE|nr:DgyrCDS14905 [Dimorphilus gyrociliatus]
MNSQLLATMKEMKLMEVLQRGLQEDILHLVYTSHPRGQTLAELYAAARKVETLLKLTQRKPIAMVFKLEAQKRKEPKKTQVIRKNASTETPNFWNRKHVPDYKNTTKEKWSNHKVQKYAPSPTNRYYKKNQQGKLILKEEPKLQKLDTLDNDSMSENAEVQDILCFSDSEESICQLCQSKQSEQNASAFVGQFETNTGIKITQGKVSFPEQTVKNARDASGFSAPLKNDLDDLVEKKVNNLKEENLLNEILEERRYTYPKFTECKTCKHYVMDYCPGIKDDCYEGYGVTIITLESNAQSAMRDIITECHGNSTHHSCIEDENQGYWTKKFDGTCSECPSKCLKCYFKDQTAVSPICYPSKCQLKYGFDDVSGTCFQCPDGCDICKKRSGLLYCLQCSKGFGPKLTLDGNIDKCIACNLIENCEHCEVLCKNSNRKCTKCPMYPIKCSECRIDPNDDENTICLQFAEDGSCKKCTANCKKCLDEFTCLGDGCKIGFIKDKHSGECITCTGNHVLGSGQNAPGQYAPGQNAPILGQNAPFLILNAPLMNADYCIDCFNIKNKKLIVKIKKLENKKSPTCSKVFGNETVSESSSFEQLRLSFDFESNFPDVSSTPGNNGMESCDKDIDIDNDGISREDQHQPAKIVTENSPVVRRIDINNESSFNDTRELCLNDNLKHDFEIFKNGSRKGKDILLHNNFTYTVKRSSETTITWKCSQRTKKSPCLASVIQKDLKFILKNSNHIHKREKNDMRKIIEARRYQSEVPSIDVMKRSANRYREGARPKHPENIMFELNLNEIPDNFFLKDIKGKKSRNMMFATDHQIKLLKHCKIWFIDATFKIVRKPFYQLFTIHGFIRKEGEYKQVPLMFVLMTGKKKKHYSLIFEELKILIDGKSPKKFVLDFEKALWISLKNAFVDSDLQGCAFHFKQAILKNIQKLGYIKDYKMKGYKGNVLRKLMCLAYLPASFIKQKFYQIKEELLELNLYADLLEYMQSTYIESNIWKPENWSVYKLIVRTNNNVESWHTRINQNLKSNENFYTLITELHRESSLIEVYEDMLVENKMRQNQKNKYKDLQDIIFELWKKFEWGVLTHEWGVRNQEWGVLTQNWGVLTWGVLTRGVLTLSREKEYVLYVAAIPNECRGSHVIETVCNVLQQVKGIVMREIAKLDIFFTINIVILKKKIVLSTGFKMVSLYAPNVKKLINPLKEIVTNALMVVSIVMDTFGDLPVVKMVA